MLKKNLNQREIKTLNDITDIAKLISRDFDLKGNGDNLYCRCPFHDERTESFCVVQKKNFFYCFGCGASGNALDWLYERFRRSHLNPKGKALTELLNFNNISVKELKKLAKEKYPDGLGYYGNYSRTRKGKIVQNKNNKARSQRIRSNISKLRSDPKFLSNALADRYHPNHYEAKMVSEYDDEIPF